MTEIEKDRRWLVSARLHLWGPGSVKAPMKYHTKDIIVVPVVVLLTDVTISALNNEGMRKTIN